MVEKISEQKNYGYIISLYIYIYTYLFIYFCSKTYFDTCFDNLRVFFVFCITSLYNTSYMVLTHLYFHKHVFNDMDIYLSKKKTLNT